MITLEELVTLAREELAKAVKDTGEGVYSSLLALLPAILTRPLLLSLGAFAVVFIDGIGNLSQSVQQVPVRVLARALLLNVRFKNSTHVCKLSDAQQFAADLALSTVFELTGSGPNTSSRLGLRASGFKGARKRLIAIEERQILGPVLKRLLLLVRAPARALGLLLQQIWSIGVALAALGAVYVLWTVVQADWSKIALSQAHKRKRMRVTISRRL